MADLVRVCVDQHIADQQRLFTSTSPSDSVMLATYYPSFTVFTVWLTYFLLTKLPLLA